MSIKNSALRQGHSKVMEGMMMIPFKKLRCVSSICIMSFAQVILISGDDA